MNVIEDEKHWAHQHMELFGRHGLDMNAYHNVRTTISKLLVCHKKDSIHAGFLSEDLPTLIKRIERGATEISPNMTIWKSGVTKRRNGEVIAT